VFAEQAIITFRSETRRAEGMLAQGPMLRMRALDETLVCFVLSERIF